MILSQLINADEDNTLFNFLTILEELKSTSVVSLKNRQNDKNYRKFTNVLDSIDDGNSDISKLFNEISNIKSQANVLTNNDIKIEKDIDILHKIIDVKKIFTKSITKILDFKNNWLYPEQTLSPAFDLLDTGFISYPVSDMNSNYRKLNFSLSSKNKFLDSSDSSSEDSDKSKNVDTYSFKDTLRLIFFINTDKFKTDQAQSLPKSNKVPEQAIFVTLAQESCDVKFSELIDILNNIVFICYKKELLDEIYTKHEFKKLAESTSFSEGEKHEHYLFQFPKDTNIILGACRDLEAIE